MTKEPFRNDMNERERQRFIKMFKDLEDSCRKCIEALELENDTELMTHALIFSLKQTGMKDLQTIFLEAVQRNAPDLAL